MAKATTVTTDAPALPTLATFKGEPASTAINRVTGQPELVDDGHRSTTVFRTTFPVGEAVDITGLSDRQRAKLAGNVMFETDADAPDKFERKAVVEE